MGMPARSWVIIGVVALLLYWIVQEPTGAADTIRLVIDWAGSMLALIATRLVEFMGALL